LGLLMLVTTLVLYAVSHRLSGGKVMASRMTRLLFRVYCALVLAFLLLPIAAIVPLSFSSGSFLTYPLPGWSLRWYDEVFNGGEVAGCAGQLAACGLAATALAVALGTLAALGLARQRGPVVAR
jgi:putative spermidine/putrescine transport system permease protein